MSELYKTRVLSFEQMKLIDLYAILRLRQQVFVIEQQSIYDDIDNCDQVSMHICVYQEDELVGYARVREADPGQLAKIERVVCCANHRGVGLGQMLMHLSVDLIQKRYCVENIMLSAQTHASDFYVKLGFQRQGVSYDDGGIEHIDMYLINN
ncbi:GNAT family N-acetyltransferase [uncultured Paraglaciecola sp.]|uniref:GNAT family N-acetyltransferase n=1 Tax=uncultured Paraglaciecola sp. TaxID=1765024 RepID=UPI0030DDAEB3